MEELKRITDRYEAAYVAAGLQSLESINVFALAFFKDVAEIFDVLTRVKNPERNPSGFDLDDAPILGLLVRISKLLRESVAYYEADKAELISILERPLIEAAVVASYLMSSPPAVIEDYRKCSYKDRLRLLRDLKAGSPFFDTKAGKRLLAAVQAKMAFESLTENDFAEQKKNRWKIQGKSFRQIFAEIEDDTLYPATYGMMSESIHGSWNESMDWGLTQNDDGTFSAFPLYHPVDVRYVAPILRFTLEPFRLWLARIDVADENLTGVLDWIERVNTVLFREFDQKYDG